jgi:hypothetical protein
MIKHLIENEKKYPQHNVCDEPTPTSDSKYERF